MLPSLSQIAPGNSTQHFSCRRALQRLHYVAMRDKYELLAVLAERLGKTLTPGDGAIADAYLPTV